MNATSVAYAFADKLSRAGLMTQEDTDMLCAIRAPKASRGPTWTAKEDRHLMRLRRDAHLPEVAQKLGRSYESVRARLKRLRQKERANG